MKTKKPRLQHNPIEYQLFATIQEDEELQAQFLYIELLTKKEFSSFQYELVVNDTIDKTTLTLHIIGLRAPKTNVPTTGAASFKKLYAQPETIKKIVVKKMEKKEDIFNVRIVKQSLVVKDKPEHPFVEIVPLKRQTLSK